MSMTRKQFLGSFAAGIAELGAMASGKVDEAMVEAQFTIPTGMTATRPKCPTCLKTDCNHPISMVDPQGGYENLTRIIEGSFNSGVSLNNSYWKANI